MVLFLGFNIRAGFLDLRLTDRKHSIAALPAEASVLRALFLHPPRWRCLHGFDETGDGDRTGKIAENVNMVLNAIDQDRFTINLLKDPGHIGMKAGREVRSL